MKIRRNLILFLTFIFSACSSTQKMVTNSKQEVILKNNPVDSTIDKSIELSKLPYKSSLEEEISGLLDHIARYWIKLSLVRDTTISADVHISPMGEISAIVNIDQEKYNSIPMYAIAVDSVKRAFASPGCKQLPFRIKNTKFWNSVILDFVY